MKKNPFSTTLYIGSEYFCDREQETKTLLSNITGGLSTTVTAIRRMGKTGLIHHVFTRLPKNYSANRKLFFFSIAIFLPRLNGIY